MMFHALEVIKWVRLRLEKPDSRQMTVLGQPRPEIAQGAAADIEEIHILYEAAVRNNVEIVPVEQDDQRRHIFAGFQSAQV